MIVEVVVKKEVGEQQTEMLAAVVVAADGVVGEQAESGLADISYE